jgi:RNase P/RNase MRP subunit POP5
MKRTLLAILTASTCALAMAAPMRASAADAELDCKLTYNLTGWSLIYKHTTGTGVVRCADGTSMRVKVAAKALGITAGKWHIDNGKGNFSDVHSISDVLGDYAQASANAGVVKSGEAQVLTKGPVSLALAGNGEGVNIGVDVGQFTISRR